MNRRAKPRKYNTQEERIIARREYMKQYYEKNRDKMNESSLRSYYRKQAALKGQTDPSEETR